MYLTICNIKHYQQYLIIYYYVYTIAIHTEIQFAIAIFYSYNYSYVHYWKYIFLKYSGITLKLAGPKY